MLPVVTGSHALQHYGLLKNRVPSDWDLILRAPKGLMRVNGELVDVIDVDSELEPTNKIIFELSQGGNIIKTPVGNAYVIPLNLLKVMKLSSIPLNKVKNLFDLQSLSHIKLTEFENQLVQQRTNETLAKIELQKNKFFNKYQVQRFFDHDELHLLINSSPVYKYALEDNNPVLIDEEKFMNLPDKDKCLIFWEEAMVLSLERYLIPRVRKFPMMVDKVAEAFFKVEKNSDPGLYWLNKLCSIGLIKDHPDWLANWGIEHYGQIIQGFPQWWNESFDNLDQSFWDKLLKF